MSKIKNVLATIWPLAGGVSGVLITLLILLASAKSCFVKSWSPPPTPEAYRVEGGDGRTLYLLTFPDREAILAYYTSKGMEISRSAWKGVYGSHLLGRLWHIEGPKITLGYRIYPKGIEPVVMEITTIKNFKLGSGDSSFPREGERGYEVILFGRDQVVFSKMTLERFVIEPEFAASISKLAGRDGE
ncbi:MAG: hypothetical protein ABJC13_09300 [Acidobacteriota bacterium]